MNMGSLGGLLSNIAGGKQNLVGGSLLLALVGFFWQGGGDDQAAVSRDQPAREVTTVSEYARQTTPESEYVPKSQEPTSTTSPIQKKLEDLARKHPTWGNAAMRLGLSFFVAMMIASLLKAFIKTMVTVILVVGVALFFMEQRGMIEPFWDHQMGFLLVAKDWLFAQTDSIAGFLKGYLPSTGAASAGFFVGLRR